MIEIDGWTLEKKGVEMTRKTRPEALVKRRKVVIFLFITPLLGRQIKPSTVLCEHIRQNTIKALYENLMY